MHTHDCSGFLSVPVTAHSDRRQLREGKGLFQLPGCTPSLGVVRAGTEVRIWSSNCGGISAFWFTPGPGSFLTWPRDCLSRKRYHPQRTGPFCINKQARQPLTDMSIVRSDLGSSSIKLPFQVRVGCVKWQLKLRRCSHPGLELLLPLKCWDFRPVSPYLVTVWRCFKFSPS